MDRAIRIRAAALQAHFVAHGAVPVETPILQPAEVLLDLYGEDIRARAYVTQDPLRGEQMLRPDFTVPVVQAHMAHSAVPAQTSSADPAQTSSAVPAQTFNAVPARYTYAGEVFRRQETDTGRPSEYLQVGYEVFDRADPAAADAEVFALISAPLAHLGLQAVTGDMGLLIAAVAGLDTTPARRAALRRHIWRPARFRALLDRYARPPIARRADADDAPEIGLRSRDAVAARLAALREDAAAPPLAGQDIDRLTALLAIAAPMPQALAALETLSRDLPAIAPATATLRARMAALAARGIDPSRLQFDATHGRGSMEYYDGFVFSLTAPDRPDLPPVASGGRYDALTRVLGGGAAIPAVGGVIRPETLLALEAAR